MTRQEVRDIKEYLTGKYILPKIGKERVVSKIKKVVCIDRIIIRIITDDRADNIIITTLPQLKEFFVISKDKDVLELLKECE